MKQHQHKHIEKETRRIFNHTIEYNFHGGSFKFKSTFRLKFFADVVESEKPKKNEFQCISYLAFFVYFSAKVTMAGPLSVEEVEFTFPWGKLAGKWWGSKDIRPIVVLHGWQDNAGSFDTLIPLLPSDLSYLALDLPGHGRSSHIPNAMNYNVMDYIFVLNDLKDKFNWPKISIMAHSMGSISTFIFTAIFPDKVDMVIALDTIKPQIRPARMIVKLLQYRGEHVLLADKRNRVDDSEPPTYTYAELVDRVVDGSMQSVDRDKAKYMIERGVKESEKYPAKYYFSRDSRVKYMFDFHVDQNTCLEMVKKIQIPYLFVKANDKNFSENPKHIKEAISQFQQTNSNFKMINVPGTHHAHLNSPELMAHEIGSFLTRYRSNADDNAMTSKMTRSKL